MFQLWPRYTRHREREIADKDSSVSILLSPKVQKSGFDTWIILAHSRPLHITSTHNNLSSFSNSRCLQWREFSFQNLFPVWGIPPQITPPSLPLLSFFISAMLHLNKNIMLMSFRLPTLTERTRYSSLNQHCCFLHMLFLAHFNISSK